MLRKRTENLYVFIENKKDGDNDDTKVVNLPKHCWGYNPSIDPLLQVTLNEFCWSNEWLMLQSITFLSLWRRMSVTSESEFRTTGTEHLPVLQICRKTPFTKNAKETKISATGMNINYMSNI